MTGFDEIMPVPFTIELVEAPPSVTLLVLSGEVDLATSGRFRHYAEQAAQSGAHTLIADLAGVSFIDSTMLRELLRARDAMAGAGGRLVIAGAGPPVIRLLDLTRTAALFELADSRDAAVAESAR